MVPRGPSRALGIVWGMGETKSGGMVPRGTHLKLKIQAATLVGLCWLGDVVETRVAIPAKGCTQSWHSDGSYRRGPKKDFHPGAIWGRLTLALVKS